MNTKPMLLKAAQLIDQARAVRERYGDGEVPSAEDARQIDRLLKESQTLRRQAERDEALRKEQDWMAEPQYKHDMVGGPAMLGGGFAAGAPGVTLPGDVPLTKASRAFFSYVRSGTVPVEHKADLVENATGLNLVPNDYAGTILKELPREGVLKSLAYVRPTTKAVVDVGNVVINTAGWGRLETGTALTDGLGATPAAKDQIFVHDLNALVKVGRDELEDSDENLADIIRQALVMKFAELEDDAYAAGTGTAQPFGIATRVTGGVITQGITAAANATLVGDDLKKLIYAVPARFRKSRSVYLMHTSAQQAAALLKDTNGSYLFQPKASEGEPDTLLGYRAYTVDGLPAMTASGTAVDPSVIFGDVYAGYMVADRQQVRVLRLEERYADEGKVGLLFTLRTGGDVVRPKALAALKL